MGSIAALQDQLRSSIAGEVRFTDADRALYATDASNYRMVPLGVVLPRDEGDVIKTVTLARDNDIALLPRGGGTALGGQTCNQALVIDFSKYMHAIRSIDFDRRLAVVEPGVVQAQLNRALATHGLQFAPDPTTKNRCCLGGMIGNNSCGTHSVEHGKTVDNLAALEVVLYDGTTMKLGPMNELQLEAAIASGGRQGELYRGLRELRQRHLEDIRSGFPQLPRRVSGYNLDQLLPENNFHLARAVVGSEGTLALTLNATVQLVPLPRFRALVVMGFSDVFNAADQVPWILNHRPQALEGFDNRLVEFCRLTATIDLGQLLPPGESYLFAELGGASADEARGRAEALIADARRQPGAAACKLFTEERDQRAVWEVRESGLGASAAVPGRPRTWPGAEDAAVPPARLGQFLRDFQALLQRHNLEAATFYGHFGDGCVHCRINFDFQSQAGLRTFRAAMVEYADMVAAHGGSLSGEHGDGRARGELLPRMYRPELIRAFGEFKALFDPRGGMNPGIIVNPEPLDARLRLRPGALPAVSTDFDFSADQGFVGATLKCVGIGQCRKLQGGAMCPSYMATREETHSTRGRAHLLYEALSGEFFKGAQAEQAVLEALDLCLACKSCKRECPAGVDLATYKSQFLANYYRKHWRPLPAHFFARIHQGAAVAAHAPRLVNWLMSASPLAPLIKGFLHVDGRRTLPRFAAQTFRAWFAKHQPPAQGRPVMLFVDTFSNFFDPKPAIAAVAVMERAGFRVQLPARDFCCGRPLFDQGMLSMARRWLEQAMAIMAPALGADIPIVGLEPGCLLTFRDELPGLFPDEPRAKKLAKSSLLFDEFLTRHAPGLPLPEISAQALLHGHCHQKALAHMEGEVAILKRIPGLQLEVLDAGCCGMAGAFGYAQEHYEVSRAIGERVLMPAVRANGEALIISDGFSCRSQIAQLAPGRRAMHLAEVLNLNSHQPST
ncbi:MAG TPA: FAD-linked oxidase C-terminal domain-containing protein [Candidatus Binataceae bacterium]|nr:FAD-linked oxidase C-terminal domain-containing protein [Candidatus Binataceae bacterium]